MLRFFQQNTFTSLILFSESQFLPKLFSLLYFLTLFSPKTLPKGIKQQLPFSKPEREEEKERVNH